MKQDVDKAGVRVEFTLRRSTERLRLTVEGAEPMPKRIPRISKLMALAIKFDGLLREGVVRDYADLARLGGVSRARITQIMNLLNLRHRPRASHRESEASVYPGRQ